MNDAWNERGPSGRLRSGKRSPAHYSIWVAALLVLFGAATARAQGDLPPLPVDPTPLAQLITAEEKAELAEANKPKKAISVYVKIADSHIDAALSAVKGSDSRRSERELDIFQKAMGECVKVVSSLTDGRRSEAKKIEQAIYKQLRSLEAIEEAFPVERVQFADAAILKAKQFRVQMLNIAIASGDVLMDPDKPKPEKDQPSRPPASELPPSKQSRYARAILRFVAWHPNAGRASLAHAGSPAVQMRGDYMTEEEDDHVREAQEPDQRIKVFMKIADRRLEALTGTAATTDPKANKKLEEEKKSWGELPKLGRAVLLRQYASAIEECMAKLEDAYERNPKSKSLSKALSILQEATDRQLQTLKTMARDLKDQDEIDAMRRAIDEAEVANEGARKGPKGKKA